MQAIIEPDLITAELADEVVAEAEAVTTLSLTPSPSPAGRGEGASVRRPSVTLVRQVVEIVPGRDYVAEARAIAEAAERVCAAARETFALARMRQVAKIESDITDTRVLMENVARNVDALASFAAPAVAPVPVPLAIRSHKARHAMDKWEPLFLDLETTGKTKKDKVVEIAVLDAQGHVVFSTLVNPERPIPAEASAINYVYDRDVVDAPTWEQVLPKLRPILEGRVVIAHYARFDRNWIPNDWGVDWICTKELSDEVFGKADWMEAQYDWRRSGKLVNRLRQCGLQPGPEHSAAGDCLSTLRLLQYLAGYDRPVELVY